MKKLMLIIVATLFASDISFSQSEKDTESVRTEILNLSESQKKTVYEMSKLRKESNEQNSQIRHLQTQSEQLASGVDSLFDMLHNLSKVQDKDRTSFKNELQETNKNTVANLEKMDIRTICGCIMLFITIIGFGGYLYVKRQKYSSSFSEVRKAQEVLQEAQVRLKEDSIKLDNQMLTLIQHQIVNIPTKVDSNETDHSLALKVADEIVRIELNLSRMDSSVKGYKQLSKAVERIKNNFLANGYEIIDMLGKPYNEGMKVVANFVPDDNLKEGEQIITGITKPQINYNGQMIQSAQITVSQNI